MRETSFVDTVSVPAANDPAARDRKIETACYGEPTKPEGGGIGFVLALWFAFGAGCWVGAYVASLGL